MLADSFFHAMMFAVGNCLMVFYWFIVLLALAVDRAVRGQIDDS